MQTELSMNINISKAQFVITSNYFKENNMSSFRTVSKYELALFLTDAGYSVINGKKYPVKKGAIRLHKPDDEVCSYRFGDVYVIHFTVDENSDKQFEKLNSFTYTQDFDSLLKLFQAASESYIDGDTIKCIGCLWRILSKIATNDNISETNDIVKIKEYIEQNFNNKITLDQISELFYMHPVYLQKKFKKATGSTPTDYIKTVRVNEAKKLLISTNYSVEAIAEKTGFCNTSYFIKVFKNELNCTPAKFRSDAFESIKYI